MKEDWITALQNSFVGAEEKVPKGWLTAFQIQEKYFPKYTVKHVRDLLSANVKKFERTKFRVRLPSGDLRSVYHYKPK